MKTKAKCRRNSGFTLVELLVVIAIIGILVALLLPAVQAAREASRRAQCTNNLKQIGLAIHNYESTRKVLPPGAYFTNSPSARRGSIFIYLLPFIEAQLVYDAFDFTKNTDGQVYAGSGDPIGATVISAYRCPSDNVPNTFTPIYHPSIEGVGLVAVHNYAASRGANALSNNSSCSCANNWNSFAIDGPYPETDPRMFSGPFTRRGISLKMNAIRDGLSNTIFFGEVLPRWSWTNGHGWATSNNGCGYDSTLIPINYDTSNNSSLTGGPDPCHAFCNYNTEVGFKSAHPGGANFSYGDGSVHFLPESIDYQIYQYLGAKEDGQAVSANY